MKVALLSDIHGNLPALQAVLAAARTEADRILFLGDLAGYYPWVESCAVLLAAHGATGVRGNHDQVFLDCAARGQRAPEAYARAYGTALQRALDAPSPTALAWLRSLPPQARVDLDGRRLLLQHGAPWDPLDGRVYPDFASWERFDDVDADVVAMGHTHYPLARRQGSRILVNPGSVGQPRDRQPGACWALLDLARLEVTLHRVPYDPAPLLADARAHDPGLPYLQEVLTRR